MSRLKRGPGPQLEMAWVDCNPLTLTQRATEVMVHDTLSLCPKACPNPCPKANSTLGDRGVESFQVHRLEIDLSTSWAATQTTWVLACCLPCLRELRAIHAELNLRRILRAPTSNVGSFWQGSNPKIHSHGATREIPKFCMMQLLHHDSGIRLR